MSGWSALFHAVSGGHLDIVCHLLEDEEDDYHEADLALKDFVSQGVASAFVVAMQPGKWGVQKRLVLCR